MRKAVIITICFLIPFLVCRAEENIYSIDENEIFSRDVIEAEQMKIITAFEVSPDHASYKTMNGVLYSKDGKTLIAYPAGRKDAAYQMEDTVEEIAPCAFSFTQLQWIHFPAIEAWQVERIGENAFFGCENLRQICLQPSISFIGEQALHGCSEDLIVITQQDSPADTLIQQMALFTHVSLQDFSDMDEWIGMDRQLAAYPQELSQESGFQVMEGVLFYRQELRGYPGLKRDESYRIPDGTTHVFPPVMQNKYLKKIYIPDSCTEINCTQSAFGQMELIEVDEQNPRYACHEGVLYTKDFSTLLCYPQNKEADIYQVKENTKILAPDCMAHCRKTRQIILPQGLCEIGLFAFYGSEIREINIPSSVTTLEIEAFEDCSSLDTIWLDESSWANEIFQMNAEYINFSPIIRYSHPLQEGN